MATCPQNLVAELLGHSVFSICTYIIMQRDSSRDRTDIDVIRENHRFLWDDDDGGGDGAKNNKANMTWDGQGSFINRFGHSCRIHFSKA